MDSAQTQDRAMGAIFGSALGDAIGIYTEFMTPAMAVAAYGSERPAFTLVEPETPLHQDSHRCRFESRAWTDDTDHAILIILSYLRTRELAPGDFATRLHSWCNQGLRVLDRLPMGLGRTVGSVVHAPSFLSDPVGTALSHWEKSGRSVAPNGSLMRTAPVGVICINASEPETFATAIRMGEVTHADPRCAVSVVIVCGLIRGLCRGEIMALEHIDQVIERAWTHVSAISVDPLDRTEFDRYVYHPSDSNSSLSGMVLCDRTMGYVYKCLGSALWCLRRVMMRQDTFRSAMTTLVMHGGDADTNGAVAGALMGALCGYAYLPPEWRDGMRHGEWYRGKIDALCVVAGLKDGSYESSADRDTKMDGGWGVLSEAEMKRREMEIMERILLADAERRQAVNRKVQGSRKSRWMSWLSS